MSSVSAVIGGERRGSTVLVVIGVVVGVGGSGRCVCR